MAEGQIKQEYEAAKEDGRVQKLMTALQGGLSRSSAIVYANLKRATVYERMKTMPDFQTQIEDAEEYWLAVVNNKKMQKINEGYWPAIQLELKAKQRADYGDYQKVEHTGQQIVKVGKAPAEAKETKETENVNEEVTTGVGESETTENAGKMETAE